MSPPGASGHTALPHRALLFMKTIVVGLFLISTVFPDVLSVKNNNATGCSKSLCFGSYVGCHLSRWCGLGWGRDPGVLAPSGARQGLAVPRGECWREQWVLVGAMGAVPWCASAGPGRHGRGGGWVWQVPAEPWPAGFPSAPQPAPSRLRSPPPSLPLSGTELGQVPAPAGLRDGAAISRPPRQGRMKVGAGSALKMKNTLVESPGSLTRHHSPCLCR